jgi:uncharacterized membrane protein
LVVDIPNRHDRPLFFHDAGTYGLHDGLVHLPQSNSDSAREILDKRYALGEISKEEYEEKRKDIDLTDR